MSMQHDNLFILLNTQPVNRSAGDYSSRDCEYVDKELFSDIPLGKQTGGYDRNPRMGVVQVQVQDWCEKSSG
jgi:hypothetical protein